jgi:hypothetical protein
MAKRKRETEKQWEEKLNRKVEHEIKRKLNNYKKQIKKIYGYVADPNLPTWENAKNIIASTTSSTYFSKPKNLACHNLCTKVPPKNFQILLGLGLNYALKTPRVKNNTKTIMKRFRNDIRRKYFFQQRPENKEKEDYIPKLYLKTSWEPPEANETIEECMDKLENKIEKLNNSKQKKLNTYNLTAQQQTLLNKFKNDKTYKIWPTDKNLGTAITETDNYIERALQDHLNDKETYQRLTKTQIKSIQANIKYKFDLFKSENIEKMSQAEHTDFKRAREQCEGKIAKFYLTAKVHKTPWKTRPVVASCGTLMNTISKWIDYQLQKIAKTIPTYIRDSFDLKEQLTELDKLPRNAKLFTADATSMYTNIDTTHAIEKIGEWLEQYKHELPKNFPTEKILEGLNIVMNNNIFKFGDEFFKQIAGTAMGTSAACMYAILYFAYHERRTLLTKYKDNLIFLRRFIDDILGIWIDDGDNTKWENFQKDLNDYGKLKWKIEERCKETNFLDMTIIITNNGKIKTKPYQKEMNLYLYIPPSSAHPAGMIKGLIYSAIRRYKRQNTDRKDFVEMVRLLYQRLRDRGWEKQQLYELFIDAVNTIDKGMINNNKHIQEDETSFIHCQYHPDGITRRELQRTFESTCSKLQQQMKINKLTVAFSRPKNIRDHLAQSKLTTSYGKQVSTHL